MGQRGLAVSNTWGAAMATDPMTGMRPVQRTNWSAGGRSRWLASSAGNTAALAGAIALLAGAHGVAAWSGDPGGRTPTFATLAIVAASLATLSWSAWRLVESNLSPWRPVFRGRRVTLCAGVLALVAALLVASLVVRDPFQSFFMSGRITAHELVDVACILGAIVSLTLASAAAKDAWDAFEDERHWGRSLGIG